MTSHLHQLQPELDSDSVASSPRSDHFSEPFPPLVRFMCSFGGSILPRPHDNQLRYVGGETRMVALYHSISFSALLLAVSKLTGTTNVTVKYQLPNEDLDSLISVTTDEDVENMMDEYERFLVAHNRNPRSPRLRLFLFPNPKGHRDHDSPPPSTTTTIASLLDGSATRENWFLDALNGGGTRLQRGPSEASSLVSDVPDYLLGLDNSDDTRHREPSPRPKPRHVGHNDICDSDSGSPAPVVVSSPFCSTSSAPVPPSIPNLPPVKTKPESPVPLIVFSENQTEGFQAETGEQSQPNPYSYPINQVVHYSADAAYVGHSGQPAPVYYVPVQRGNVPVQPVPVRAPYAPPYHAVLPAQVPMGYHHLTPGSGQVYGGGMRPVNPVHPYNAPARVVPDGVRQQMYHTALNSGAVSAYTVMRMTGGDELHRTGAEFTAGRGTNTPND